MLNTGRTRQTKALTVYELIRDHCPEFKDLHHPVVPLLPR